MYFLPLLIGLISIMSPFLGMIAIMAFAARNIALCITAPLRSLLGFWPVPLAMLFLDSSLGSRIVCMDALIAVGGTAVIFLYALKQGKGTSLALMYASLLLVGYGLLRFQFFGTYQAKLFEDGLKIMNTQFPGLAQTANTASMLQVWKAILPSMWTVGQSLGLVIGFLVFQKLIGTPYILGGLRFPWWYNLIMIAVIPLYLVDQIKLISVNALIALCVIPLLQGLGLCWRWMISVFSNRWAAGILTIIIVLYAFILLILLGFADMWLNARNHYNGGIPHESDHA